MKEVHSLGGIGFTLNITVDFFFLKSSGNMAY